MVDGTLSWTSPSLISTDERSPGPLDMAPGRRPQNRLQPDPKRRPLAGLREVSEWAGHNNVAFTLTRYGGLFEDGSDEAVDRLDALLGRVDPPSASVTRLRGCES